MLISTNLKKKFFFFYIIVIISFVPQYFAQQKYGNSNLKLQQNRVNNKIHKINSYCYFYQGYISYMYLKFTGLTLITHWLHATLHDVCDTHKQEYKFYERTHKFGGMY